MTNGKGDKWRKTNFKKYYNGYDKVNWKKDKKDPILRDRKK